jgi:hypothetical protein
MKISKSTVLRLYVQFKFAENQNVERHIVDFQFAQIKMSNDILPTPNLLNYVKMLNDICIVDLQFAEICKKCQTTYCQLQIC